MSQKEGIMCFTELINGMGGSNRPFDLHGAVGWGDNQSHIVAAGVEVEDKVLVCGTYDHTNDTATFCTPYWVWGCCGNDASQNLNDGRRCYCTKEAVEATA